MRVRIEYLVSGVPNRVVEGQIDMLSAEVRIFVEFVRFHMEPAVSDPEWTRYEIRMEVIK